MKIQTQFETMLLHIVIVKNLVLLGAYARGDLDDLPTVDFTNPPLTEELLERSNKVSIEDRYDTKSFADEDIKLFYKIAEPPLHIRKFGDVLLLHGEGYDSKTWATRVGQPQTTMKILAAAGYRVIAIDLPGFKRKTKGRLRRSKSSFMLDLIKVLDLHQPAIVSPAESGQFSLDLVSQHQNDVGAFIPISPCCPTSQQNWQQVTIPLLIIRGDGDGVPFTEFQSTKHHNTFIVPKAGKAAYLYQPRLFHTALVNFLDFVYRPSGVPLLLEPSEQAAATRHSRAGTNSQKVFDAQEQRGNSNRITVATSTCHSTLIPVTIVLLFYWTRR